MKQAYEVARKAPVGSYIFCPVCGESQKKDYYQKVFCSPQTGRKCKDKYWNTITPNRGGRRKPVFKKFDYKEIKSNIFGH
jgi:hypothetical protein